MRNSRAGLVLNTLWKKVFPITGRLRSRMPNASKAHERHVIARAAPVYVAPPFSWTGFYIGGNIGGAWANGNVTDSLFGLSASTSRSGFIGGGQLGFNYQFTNVVLGAEWDFDWTSLNATGNGV